LSGSLIKAGNYPHTTCDNVYLRPIILIGSRLHGADNEQFYRPRLAFRHSINEGICTRKLLALTLTKANAKPFCSRCLKSQLNSESVTGQSEDKANLFLGIYSRSDGVLGFVGTAVVVIKKPHGLFNNVRLILGLNQLYVTATAV